MSMNLPEFLQQLYYKDIELWVEDDRLRYRAPAGVLDAEHLQTLKRYKAEIIAYLKNSELSQPAGEPTTLPLSFIQEGVWYTEQLQPGLATYNVPLAFRLQGKLNVTALENSFAFVIQRHETLRTQFSLIGEEPRQIVQPAVDFSLKQIDLSHLSAEDQESRLDTLVSDDAHTPFDLGQAPLLRATLFRLTSDDFALCITLHHLVVDGWSLRVLQKELTSAYAAFLTGNDFPKIADLPIQYGDFANWQQERFTGKQLEDDLVFWREQLGDDPPPLQLPTDHTRPTKPTYNGRTHTITLPSPLVAALKDLGRKENASLFMVLLATYKVLLHRYSRQDKILAGTPVANRSAHETESLIGYFANTVVLRSDLSGNPTFWQLLKQIRRMALDSFAHHQLPFEKLVKSLNPTRDLAYTPYFQTMFVHQNFQSQTFDLAGIDVEPYKFERRTAKFDLTLTATETADAFEVVFEYSTEMFQSDTIERMANHWQMLLAGAAADPDQEIGQLPLLNEIERQQILAAPNSIGPVFPVDLTLNVIQRFEQIAEKSPDKIAVQFGGSQLTYKRLNQRANQLAHHLKSLQVGPEIIVGVCIERSLEMIVGLLGILKSGAAYLPLDINYPPERLAFMLDDAEAPLLLTQTQLLGQFPRYTGQTVCLDDLQDLDRFPTTDLGTRLSPDSLAYIIYTSGSSGQPKGVMIEHKALTNFTEVIADRYSFTAADRILQFATICFDTSVEEIFLAFTQGATLVLRNEEMLDTSQIFWRHCAQMGLTVIHLPTAYWHYLVSEMGPEPVAWPPSLKLVVLGGEKAQVEAVNHWLDHAPPSIRLINSYGPTETTVVATAYDVVSKVHHHQVPIGRPIGNMQAYILDAHQQLVPVGVPGELCVGGLGLARGYLKRPELTSRQFIDPPANWDSSEFTGGKFYKTGDLVRYLKDGNIEFLGRIDDQVKIRGYRVELGEVESTLAHHPHVQEVVVIAREDTPGDHRLVAYIVPADDSPLTAAQWRSYLQTKLPDYMIPAAYVELDRFPLTINGKLDRRALPTPTIPAADSIGYVPPSNEIEKRVATIWQEVLKAEHVGINDNFFDLGGHSLLATQIVSRIGSQLDVSLPLIEFFATPTVADVAEKITTLQYFIDRSAQQAIEPVSRDEPPLLSFAQQRLWILNQIDSASNAAYNVPLTLRCVGDIDRPALEKSLNGIVGRHEALRTTIVHQNLEPHQMIHDAMEIDLPLVDLRHLAVGDREEEAYRLTQELFQQSFDFEQGPLLRAQLLKLADDEHLLAFVFHHIVFDGWSMAVFNRELSAFYNAYCQNQTPMLPELPIQYADFSAWQQGLDLEPQLAYWKKQLAGAPHTLNLPTSFPRPNQQTFNGANVNFVLSADLTQALYQLSQKNQTTLFMTLLTAYNLLLYRYSNQADILVGTPIANRVRPELEPLIGYFLNTLVMRTKLFSDATFHEILQQVKETTLQAYDHQDIPVEKLIAALQPERDMSYSPLFQATFQLQNMPDDKLTLPALELTLLPFKQYYAKVDLNLVMIENEGAIEGRFDFNTDLFDRSMIEAMAGHFQTLLAGAIQSPDRPISQLPLLTQAELETQRSHWNKTQIPFPNEKSLVGLFLEQVEQRPHEKPFFTGQSSISYADIHQRSLQLAEHLKKKNINPNDVVGVCLPRSFDAIVAIMATFYVGGVYLPLDPNYPHERLKFMMSDSGAKLIITASNLQEIFADQNISTVCLSQFEWHEQSRFKPVSVHTNPDDPAYIIYTSGSTGRPKGVQLPHRQILNRLHWMWREYPLDSSSIGCHKTSLNFVDSLWEIFGPLLQGLPTLILTNEEVVDPTLLLKALGKHKVTHLWLVPTLLNVLIDLADTTSCNLSHLTFVAAGGEALPTALLKKFQKRFPHSQLLNSYGASEFWDAAWYAPQPEHAHLTTVPIGQPIDNMSCFILDEHLQPLPVGVPGQLCIAGIGLGRYIHESDQTAAKYKSLENGQTVFLTGDLARYLPTGDIEFLGRQDFQVKINGYRVELGEIEAVLAQSPFAKESAVAVFETGGLTQLAAFIVSHGDEIDKDDVRRFLLKHLPSFMVPTRIQIVSQMPLTPSGKVNRLGLIEQLSATPIEEQNKEALPSSQIGERLAEIWSSLLALPQVGLHDDFFVVGGNSIIAVRLFAAIKKEFNTNIPLAAIFESNTIAKLEKLIEQHLIESFSNFPSLVPIQPRGNRPPLFLIHALGGHVVEYRRLSKFLGEDQPVFGLQARGVSGEAEPLNNIPNMAAAYLAEIQQISEGPFQIGGYSLGGWIAYEMACQLEAMGQSVENLIIFDSRADVLPHFFNTLTAKQRVEYRMNYAKQRIDHHWNRFSSETLSEKLMYVSKVKQKREEEKEKLGFLGRVDQDVADSLKQIWDANREAVRNFNPSRYRGDIKLFKSIDDGLNSHYGWHELIDGTVTEFMIPGAHGEILKDSNVESLANLLQSILK